VSGVPGGAGGPVDERWVAVERYFAEHLVKPDSAFDAVLAASEAAGLPAAQIEPSAGKLLELLVRVQGARIVLELGTLGGYSTLWLARALPQDGCLITLEADPHHAEVALGNIARAGLSPLVELHVGDARETLPRLADQGRGPFDLIFIDADKKNNPAYLEWALNLSRRGTLIVADNVVRNGNVLDPDSADPIVQGVRRFTEMLAAEPRVSATAIQTVSSKGYDGFVLALVTG
jgi:predicted O-methyltransferase YrrM